jgi:hypothetical protein
MQWIKIDDRIRKKKNMRRGGDFRNIFKVTNP